MTDVARDCLLKQLSVEKQEIAECKLEIEKDQEHIREMEKSIHEAEANVVRLEIYLAAIL